MFYINLSLKYCFPIQEIKYIFFLVFKKISFSEVTQYYFTRLLHIHIFTFISRYFILCFMIIVNGILSPFSHWLLLVYKISIVYMYFIMLYLSYTFCWFSWIFSYRIFIWKYNFAPFFYLYFIFGFLIYSCLG